MTAIEYIDSSVNSFGEARDFYDRMSEGVHRLMRVRTSLGVFEMKRVFTTRRGHVQTSYLHIWVGPHRKNYREQKDGTFVLQ